MKGSYPLAWMILSAVMLNMQFVGIYCGSSWRHVIPLHVKQQAHNQYLEWFLIPPKEPPDPVHSVNNYFNKDDLQKGKRESVFIGNYTRCYNPYD